MNRASIVDGALRTPRLLLLPCRPPVAQAIMAGAGALEALLGVRPAADWPGPNFRAYLPQLIANPARGRWNWLVIHPEDRLIIGDSGFHGPPDAAGLIELGYIFAADYRGRGYATESARALLGWACAQPEVCRVIAICAADNYQSIRVLEKLGFHRAGDDGDELHWTFDCERCASGPQLTTAVQCVIW
ncbi:MAG TPA: GNAT family N-acetyltransferase [Thermomicrobiales bacterium]|jgi:RimJ/RimL family protein N-acetyltransferase